MKYLLVVMILFPTVILAEEDMVTVPRSEHFFLDAPDNDKFPVRTFKEHFYAKWLEAWQHVVLSQDLQKSLNMCIEEANGNPPPCTDAGDFRDGAGGALWKPFGDPNASCRNRAVFLLPASYNGKVGSPGNKIDVLDVNFNKIGDGFFRSNSNPDRPTFCTDRTGPNYGAGPIYVRYTVDGFKECRTVRNPSNRED